MARLWWFAALAVSGAGAVHGFTLPSSLLIASAGFGWCPGYEASLALSPFTSPVSPWLLWSGGLPVVASAFGAHWLATRRGRPRIGRAIARVVAAALLIVGGTNLLALGVDLVAGPAGCFDRWGGAEGLTFHLGVGVWPTVAAGCVLAAVRGPGRGRLWTVRRGAAGVATLALLALLPVGEIAPAPAAGCDTDACRALAAQEEQWLRDRQADGRALTARQQRICDEARRPPRGEPVVTAHRMMSTSHGVFEGYEGEIPDAALLDQAQAHGLVATAPGHIMILSSAGHANCVTAEAYARRPPLEVKGWDRVVEVGYESTTGVLALGDPMGAPVLPNLAFRGEGHYRVRVHYREPDPDWWTPQHLLVQVFPGRSDRVVEHLLK